jgi:hypothetical protein
MARPGRLELPTLCLEGRRSIRLSYGRISGQFNPFILLRGDFDITNQRNVGAV